VPICNTPELVKTPACRDSVPFMSSVPVLLNVVSPPEPEMPMPKSIPAPTCIVPLLVMVELLPDRLVSRAFAAELAKTRP
jgi:hypothetical protein